MISLRRLPMLLAAVLMLATAAFAQTTGTVTVSGSNPETFSLTNTSGGTLSSTIALGVLTPGNTNTLTEGTAEIRVRSNKKYKLTAEASPLLTTGLGDVEGGDTISLSDIGFGVMSMTLTGANVAASGSRTDAPLAGYSVASWPTPTNGLTPAFGKTLNDISSPTQILSGPRISKKGNLITDNNFISITFGVATLPQFHTPNTGFSSIITLTIASQ